MTLALFLLSLFLPLSFADLSLTRCIVYFDGPDDSQFYLKSQVRGSTHGETC
jgi:hypothetical protein